MPRRVYLFVSDSVRFDYYGKTLDGASLTMINLLFERLREEVFDVGVGPYEQANILDTEAGCTFQARAKTRFAEHIKMLKARRVELSRGTSEVEMDSVLKSRLRNLGYLE